VHNVFPDTCWSEAEIPPEATCRRVALAKTEAAAGKPETLNGNLGKVIPLRWGEKLRLFRSQIMLDRVLRVDH
jgi:hypothetical protein